MANITYFVALPFVAGDDGPQPGEAVECRSAAEAKSRAASMARDPKHVGALAFERSGDPNEGEFEDAKVLATFGDAPSDLSGL